MSIKNLLNDNFNEEVLESKDTILVDFWAPWCGYCKRLNPVIDAIQEEYSEKIKIAKVNVDEADEIAQEYKIMTIPRLMIFKEGKVLSSMEAPKSKADVDKWLKENGVI